MALATNFLPSFLLRFVPGLFRRKKPIHHSFRISVTPSGETEVDRGITAIEEESGVGRKEIKYLFFKPVETLVVPAQASQGKPPAAED